MIGSQGPTSLVAQGWSVVLATYAPYQLNWGIRLGLPQAPEISLPSAIVIFFMGLLKVEVPYDTFGKVVLYLVTVFGYSTNERLVIRNQT